jgi:hypothetical protein
VYGDFPPEAVGDPPIEIGEPGHTVRSGPALTVNCAVAEAILKIQKKIKNTNLLVKTFI